VTTTRVAVVELPAQSIAVAVIVLLPGCRATPFAVHALVRRPVRTRSVVPLMPSVVFDQSTRASATLSDALPFRSSEVAVLGVACQVISTSGAIESTFWRRTRSAWLIVASSSTAAAVTSGVESVLVSLALPLVPPLPPPQAVRTAANRTERVMGTGLLR